MVTATLEQSKSTTVAEIDNRGSGRDKIQIAHQFLNIPPFDVELPSHLSLSAGKIALQTWVNRQYPKHVVLV